MKKKRDVLLPMGAIGLSLLLTACFKPPYNNFRADHKVLTGTATGLGAGAAVGALAGNAAIGTAIGGAGAYLLTSYKDSRQGLINQLTQNQSVQYVEHGDTKTLIVPTDKYFFFGTSTINDLCFPGLNMIAKLLKKDPNSKVYVAAFSDNVGTKEHKKKLTQAQAEAVLTFLWAKNIPARLLVAEGYADKHPIANDALIHGSAMNRRIEIQWVQHAQPSVRQSFMDKFGRLMG